jgi:hypothetical protein
MYPQSHIEKQDNSKRSQGSESTFILQLFLSSIENSLSRNIYSRLTHLLATSHQINYSGPLILFFILSLLLFGSTGV